MSTIDNINGIYAKDTELRSGIDTLRTTVVNQTIKPLNVTKNGTYTAIPSSGTYGYSPVIVNIPIGYEFPEGTEYTDIAEVVKGDPLVDESVDAYPKIEFVVTQNNTWGMSCGYVDITDGSFTSVTGWDFGISSSDEKPTVVYAKILDPTTGYCEFKARYVYWGSYTTQTLNATIRKLIGYGESGHTYKVKNS